MASITKRGEYQFQAIIRRKGYPCQTKIFETRLDAEKWVRDVESKMDKGLFRDRREIEHTTLGDALERYGKSFTPTKRGHIAEANRTGSKQRWSVSIEIECSEKSSSATLPPASTPPNHHPKETRQP